MSDQDDRKSMDDVLASIRRIVRAEKEPDAEDTAGAASSPAESAPEEAPEAVQPAPVQSSPPPPAPEAPVETPPEATAAPTPATEEGEPLALTPDMRRDDADPGELPPVETGPSDNAAAALAGSAAAIVATATDAEEPAPMGIDRSDIREMVLDVLREELAAGGSGAEAIKGIIRDELMAGEIGQNISQNVMTLIQSEVSKALDK